MDDLREHQLIAVDALKFLKDICEKNQVRYYLLAGSCLGAVREGGFIPWDDDIDVGILNKDYEKMDRILTEQIKAPYKWISNTTDADYPRMFGKILHNGIACVDLFRIVHLPVNPQEIQKIWRCRSFWLKLFARKCHRTFESESFFNRNISAVLAFFVSRNTVVRMCRKNENRCIGDGDYLNLYSIYGLDRETIKKEQIETQSTVLFEGTMYTTVSDTDAYLTHLYGDYMTPPPEADRQRRHVNSEF